MMKRKAFFKKMLHCLKKCGWILLLTAVIIAAIFGVMQAVSGGRNRKTAAGNQLLSSLAANDVGEAVRKVQSAQAAANSAADMETAAAETAETENAEAETDGTETAADTVSTETQTAETVISADEFRAEYEALLDAGTVPALTEEEIAAFRQQFSDTVFFGDSMTQAIGEYGIASEDRVVYLRGGTLTTILPNMDKVRNIYPARIVIWVGLNNCSQYLTDYDGYMADLTTLLNSAAEICGMENVYVCSLLPGSDAISAARGDLALAPDYDTMLQQNAESAGAHYIDTKWIVRQSLYLDDCIHMNSTFYAVWARYMMKVMN